MIGIRQTGSIAHESADSSKLAKREDRGQRMPRRECNDLIPPGKEKRIGFDQCRFDFFLNESRKGCIEVALGAGPDDNELLSKLLRRCLCVSRGGLGIWIVRVHQHTDHSGGGHQFAQQLQSFCDREDHKKADAREIAPRPVEAGNEAGGDRVEASDEDDGNCGCGGFCSLDRNVAANRDDDIHSAVDQIRRQGWQSIDLIVRRSVFDRHVLAFDIPGLLQAPVKSEYLIAARFEGHAAEQTDHRHRLLRARRERPRGCRAPEKRDELAALHSITLSARSTRPAGTSWPIAFAVLRLMTSSKWVGCSTEISAGLAPRSIRATSRARWRKVCEKRGPYPRSPPSSASSGHWCMAGRRSAAMLSVIAGSFIVNNGVAS